MKVGSSLISALALFFSSILTAYAGTSTTLFPCNGCTPTQYYNMTISLARSYNTLGPIYIADFTNDVLTASTVEREPNGVGGYTYSANPATIPQVVQNGFNAWHSVIVTYHTAGIVIAPVTMPRPNGYPSVVDSATGIQWVASGNYVNLFEDFLTNLQATGVGALSFTPEVLAVLAANQTGITVPYYTPTIQFVITTTPGDTVRINWLDAAASLVKVTDRYGNSIPLTRADAHGTYQFDGSTDAGVNYAHSFMDYLNTLGAGLNARDNERILSVTCSVGIIQGCTYDEYVKPN